jgi:UDP-arabinose 4-epimerase
MRKVLVTGGAGYIGSHTCQVLAKRGYTPVTYDNLVYGHEWAVKWGPFYRGDLFDQDLLRSVMQKEKIEAVLHFAAYAYVGESVQDPLKYYRNNVGGTISLLEACKAVNVKRFVFSSTCATYGLPKSVPIEETAEQNPINPYGQTKLMMEKALRDLCAAGDMKAVALRYFNAAGADPGGEIGEHHDPETHLIPLVLRAATNANDALTIYGNDYSTPDGTCIRDYIHVVDLAEAHVLALEKMESLPDAFSVFNLGTGRGHSVAEVIAAAEKVVGRPVSRKQGPRRPGDPPALVASGERAKKVLGWSPRHSDLKTILETAWRWHQKHFAGEKR